MQLRPVKASWAVLLLVILLGAATTADGAPAGVASELPQDLQQLQPQSLQGSTRAVVSTVSSVSATTSTTAASRSGTTRSPDSASKGDGGAALDGSASSTFHLLEEFTDYTGGQNITEGGVSSSSYRLGYTVDAGGSVRKFRYEERTPEGAIVGEFGFHKNDGVIRGVRYSAEPGVHPKVLYEALVKFFTL